MTDSASPETVKDLVCGMDVNPETTAHSLEHDSETYYFCGASCREKFAKDPAGYLSDTPREIKAEPGAMYTCPMDPEVQQIGPGICPKCGMALEPMDFTAEEGDDPELIDMTRRFWIAVALSVPVFVLAMGDMVFGWAQAGMISERALVWIQFVLASPVVWWCGWPFFVRAVASFRTMHLNMFSLIAVGTGTAYGYSVVAMIAPSLFPEAARNAMGRVPVYYESAAVIIALVLLGQVMELRARRSTRGAIRGLLDLSPKTARRITEAGEEELPLQDVAEGDRLRVKPGESIPTDGTIVDGSSSIDESLVTGESAPADKGPGDSVTGGTINGNGVLTIEATRVGADTVLSQIVRMVGQAQRSRAPIQAVADRVAGYFVPAVIAVAVATFAGWLVYGPDGGVSFAIVNAVAVLIIACPCALGLATPMSIMVGVGRGAGMGVLIRDAETLQVMERVDTVIVDKTGTLTEGKPVLAEVVSVEGVGDDEVLSVAAAIESQSEHPLAESIVAGAADRGLSIGAARDVQATTGKGIEGSLDGAVARVGTSEFIEVYASLPSALVEAAADRREVGCTVVFVALDDRALGFVAVKDAIKKSTPAALKALRDASVRVVMATGDNPRTAQSVADELGIDDARAGLMPEDKIALVKELREAGAIVAMAGDGINDAPALAAAHVGIAMGTGTDVAMESAGITLLRGDLNGILRARQLSRRTMGNIRQNLFFAFVYNAVGVTVATGIFYPWFGWLLSPIIAAAAMSFSSVSVIANALRLRFSPLDTN